MKITIVISFFRHGLKSGPETWDPGPWDPETLGPWDTGPRHPAPWNWNSDIQGPGTGSLGIQDCDSETQNPERRTLRIELVTQIPCIPTRTIDWINFLHALVEKQILIITSYGIWVENLGARVDGPKHLPKYFYIWHNTKKL